MAAHGSSPARTDPANRVKWTLAGPGKLKGDDTAFMIVYAPPENLADASAQAVIMVTVVETQGNIATAAVTLTLVASSPIATPMVAPTLIPETTKG